MIFIEPGVSFPSVQPEIGLFFSGNHIAVIPAAAVGNPGSEFSLELWIYLYDVTKTEYIYCTMVNHTHHIY